MTADQTVEQILVEMRLLETWYFESGLWVIGSGFVDGRLLSGPELYKFFADARPGGFSERARQLNGYFAAVRISSGRLEVVTDRIRSYPLFYGFCENRLVLSDDAEFVQSECGTDDFDPVGRAEFLRTGQLVTGRNTLFMGLLQLQAAESLIFERGHESRCERWTDYRHHEDGSLGKSEIEQRLDDAVMASTRRLIEVADGSPIVIPLSGGYDSRLLLLSLRRLHHNNVVTFTYGRPGNGEAAISEGVAARLDYTWHFVPYSPNRWRRWARSKAAQTQHRRSHQLSILPHIQDAPALEVLTRKGLIEPGALVAPGHSGDLHAGSQLTDVLMEAPLTEAGLQAAVVAKYFRFNQSEKDASFDPGVLAERIRLSTRPSHPLTRETMADAMERWCWNERIAKFISNSVRNYEQFGLRWWFPLWDQAFTDVWMAAPLKFRHGQSLYNDYVDTQWMAVTGEQAPAVAPKKPAKAHGAVRRWVSNGRLAGVARAYLRNPMGWYGILSPEELLAMKEPGEHINAHLARRLVGRRHPVD